MLSVLIKDYQFRVCLSTTFYHFFKIFLCAETKAVNSGWDGLGFRRCGGGPREKAPSGVARGLHSEGLAAEGDSPPGCCLCWSKINNFRSECPELFALFTIFFFLRPGGPGLAPCNRFELAGSSSCNLFVINI